MRQISFPMKSVLTSLSTTRSRFVFEQGIIDTNGEAIFELRPAGGNVGDAFAQSRDWFTVKPAERLMLDHAGFSGDFRADIVQDLDHGYVVVAPKATVHEGSSSFLGWWRIDPPERVTCWAWRTAGAGS